MRFIDFYNKYREFGFVCVNDLKLLETEFDIQQLSKRTKKGLLKKLSDKFFVLSNSYDDAKVRFQIANSLVQPSYLSLEWAFRYYNFIPEGVSTYTSCTTRKPITYENEFGYFTYQRIKPELFWGYDLIDLNGYKMKIAQPEKAICDYFYLHTDKKTIEDLEGMRLNSFVIQDTINKDRLITYSAKYPKTVQSIVKLILSL